MSRNLLKWVFFFQCVFLFVLVFITEGFEGGADAICHWFISRDAPSEPMLFLDQWNKPLFTLLSAPFAQLGLVGMRVFSAVTGIITGLLLWLTARKDLGTCSWLPAVVLFLIPQYFVLLTSSMTEPLFALTLALFIFLVGKERLGLAAIIAGLSPFVRQEGIALIPLIILVLVLRKKLIKTPLVFLGTILFTLIGWAVSGDAMWIKTSFPYGSGSSDIYGSGELFHYLKYWKIIFGASISVALIIGIVSIITTSISNLRDRQRISSFELALLASLAFAVMFFSAHSYVWWKGISGSLGLIRVMACIAPSVALVAGYGLHRLTRGLGLKKAVVGAAFIMLFLATAAYQLNNQVNLPTPLGQAQIVMQRTANWLREQNTKNEVHYADAVFSYFGSDLNVVSPINKGPMPHERLDDLPVGDIVVWDAHFSPNEGRMPLDVLINHPFYKRVKTLKPDQSFNVLGDKPYVVHLFEKTAVKYVKQLTASVFYKEDFETGNKEFFTKASVGIDGSSAAVSDKNHEFITLRIKMENTMMDTILGLKLETWIKSESELDLSKIHLVSSISETHYRSTDASQLTTFRVGEWNKLTQEFELPNDLPSEFELACYVWNPQHQPILVDNLQLEYVSLKSALK